MKPCRIFRNVVRALFAATALAAVAVPAHAARVGVLSNRYATETAADFNNRIPAHTFKAIDTATNLPSLQLLLDSYDVVLVFEDGRFANAPAVGKVAAAFARSGRAVVIGTFYDQDRSDAPAGTNPNGWGALEQIDPNTTDGRGTPEAPRSLDIANMLRHPMTAGVTALGSAKFAGGNQAKPGTTVVANWKEPNARGLPDPAIAYRITDNACVIHIAIAPNYPSIPGATVDYTGDFHRVWGNAFDFASRRCVSTSSFVTGGEALAIPTLSQWGLLGTALLMAGLAFSQRRRFARR